MEQMYAGIKTGSIYSTDTLLAKAIHGSIDSTETVLRGNEKWLIGNYDSAPRLYGSTFSPLEEKFTGLSCDPEDGYEGLNDAEHKKLKEEVDGIMYDSGRRRSVDEVLEILGGLSDGVKTFGVKDIIASDYHCKQKLGGAKEDRTKTGGIDSEQWI